MASKVRKFEIHRLTISGLQDGADYESLIRDSRRRIGALANAIWEHGGKSHALEEVHLIRGELRLRFLSYKTGYRPDILDTQDFTIEPNPLTASQTGIDYTHALLVSRERWILVVEKTQGGIFPNTISQYMNWMLDKVGVAAALRQPSGDEIVVNVEPEPSGAFIDRIDALDRVTKASYRIVRPNPGWSDLDETLADEAGQSNAAHADVEMSAKPRSELRKDRGIIQRIRSLYRSRTLGHAAVAGTKDGEPDKFTTEQLGKKAYRNVQLDANGQVNPNDAYTQMEGVIEQDE